MLDQPRNRWLLASDAPCRTVVETNVRRAAAECCRVARERRERWTVSNGLNCIEKIVRTYAYRRSERLRHHRDRRLCCGKMGPSRR